MNHHHRKTELIVALDVPRADRAFDLVKQLEGLSVIYKIGPELFMGAGPEFVKELVHSKHRVFLDLKFHDIPNTVARVAKLAAFLHVEMMTLHLAGGSAMVRAVTEELKEIPLLRPKLFGVGVLTSFDDVRWAEITKSMTHHAVKVADSTEGLADSAVNWGMDGIVCSAMEITAIKNRFPNFYTVVSGVRPAGTASDDQSRVSTPSHARQLGADAVIVGRPILEAPRPRVMAEAILESLGCDFNPPFPVREESAYP